MSTYREVFFKYKNLKSKYLNDNVINSVLMFFDGIKDISTLLLSLDNECQNLKIIEMSLDDISKGKPYQYVIGYTEFLGLKFYVDNNVLIPRQETEQLVKNTIDLLKNVFQNKQLSILDMCTGSGCISISMDTLYKNKYIGVDISLDAINIARNNNSLNKTNVEFIVSDLFSNLPIQKFDCIISNPPYINDFSKVEYSTKTFEPSLALMADPDYEFYERILTDGLRYVDKEFVFAFEIGEDMVNVLTDVVKKCFDSHNIHYSLKFEKDIYDKYRFMYIICKYDR